MKLNEYISALKEQTDLEERDELAIEVNIDMNINSNSPHKIKFSINKHKKEDTKF